MNRPRVFLPTHTKQDTSKAATFGEIVVLLQAESFSPFQVELNTRIFRAELKRNGFDPNRDFILLAGPRIFDTLLYGLVISEYRLVRALMFDARTGEYIERTIQAGSTIVAGAKT